MWLGALWLVVVAAFAVVLDVVDRAQRNADARLAGRVRR